MPSPQRPNTSCSQALTPPAFVQVAAAPLQTLLNGGSLVATTDRYFWNIYRNIPKPFVRGTVIIMPYLDSSYIDVPGSEVQPHEKKASSRYFFRGILKRRFGMRSTLNDLQKVSSPHCTSPE